MVTDGSQSSGGLVQQGSIDWVALSKTTVGFSVELLARYSRAGVEALTVAVGQALFAQFSLPADAQKRLELSVVKLKAYSSAAKALWFGVGFKHLIRTLMETEQGATFVAVSSSLMVSYDCEFSAAVLKALCDKSAMPEKLTPALSQWGALVNLCAPAVTGSQFPILVEGFSRLLVSNSNKKAPRDVAATSPSDLAAAILELAQLSTKRLASLTLMGNADCGWLAALAEWLFSLRVEIIDHTGNPLYQSKGTSQTTACSFHLTIIRLEDGQSSVTQSMLHSRSQLVPPGDLSFSLRTETPYHLFYQGRSEWSNILNDTFGSLFQRLLEPGLIPLFAQVLYSGLYVYKQDLSIYRMNPWGDILFGSDRLQHQHRFMQMLHFAAARLPELVDVEKYGKDHVIELDNLDQDRDRLSWLDSKTKRTEIFEREFGRSANGIKDELIMLGYSTALVDACSCGYCKTVDVTQSSQDIASLQPHQCLSKIAVVIFEFISCLSWLDIDDTIRPSANGLMSLCSPSILTPRQIRNKYSKHEAFEMVIKLLTGFKAQVFKNPSAVAMHGLCIFRPFLANPAIGVEGQLRMRVVPGQIERNDKIYQQIDEMMNPWLTYRDNGTFNVEMTTSVIEMLGAHPLLQVVVEETLNTNSLNTRLVATPEKKTRIHWNSLYRPDREVQTQYQDSCYVGAPVEMFSWIMYSLMHVQCQKTHRSSALNSIWATNDVVKPWSGRCSIVDLPWWTDDPGTDRQQPFIQQSNEWVIAVYDDHGTLQIIFGPPSLHYCILAKLGTSDAESMLVKLDDCLVCMGLGKPSMANRQPHKLSVQYSKGGQAQKIEFQARPDRMFVDKALKA